MTREIKEHIIRCVQIDLDNAKDNLARAEMQQKRMPYDHDNNNALVRYQDWVRRGVIALEFLK